MLLIFMRMNIQAPLRKPQSTLHSDNTKRNFQIDVIVSNFLSPSLLTGSEILISVFDYQILALVKLCVIFQLSAFMQTNIINIDKIEMIQKEAVCWINMNNSTYASVSSMIRHFEMADSWALV